MEQGNRLDSTPVSAKQDTTDRGAGDTGRDAAITKMLTSGVKRDAAGRFTKGTKGPSAAPAVTPPTQADAPLGTIPAPANAPDGAYALTVQGDGLGLHAAPGASLVVAPEMPTGAGLAAFYMKGRTGAVIFDLTHSFRPEYAKPFAPGSEVVPLIEVVQPATGRIGSLRADQIEKIHSVFGVYTPVEIAMKHRPAPKALPVMSSCPEGMGEQYVDDAVAYPLVRKGETVVYDPSLREPTHGALCLLQWNNGTRDVMLTNQRTVGDLEGKWWVDPVNRPASREAGPLYASDGPYDVADLREKIVGTVVGILGPSRQQDPLPQALHERDRDTAAAFATAVCRDSAAAVGTALTDANLNSKISEEISSAIEDHSEAIAAGRHEPDQSDEAFNRHSARQTETDTVLRNAPVRSLADLRAKLTYLIPLMAPDMLDQTHVAHLTKILGDVDALCRRPLVEDDERWEYAFHSALADHRLAFLEHEGSCNPADSSWVKQSGGDTSEEAMASAVAVRNAASERQDRAWSDLFKVRPRTWHSLSMLLQHVATYYENHDGMLDGPDVFGALIGAVNGLRLASKELTAPHDLSSLDFNQLEDLADICRQQSRILLTFQARCGAESPLEHILDRESNRIGLLGCMATDEIERRAPTNKDDRNFRLEALIKAELSGNGYVEPALLAEAVAAWGA